MALRNLSIVMRQKASLQAENGEDRLRHIEAGLTRAREAVQLDTKDGISWSVFGFSNQIQIQQFLQYWIQ